MPSLEQELDNKPLVLEETHNVDILQKETFRRNFNFQNIVDFLNKNNVTFKNLLINTHKGKTEYEALSIIYLNMIEGIYPTITEHKLITQRNIIDVFTDYCLQNKYLENAALSKYFIKESFFKGLLSDHLKEHNKRAEIIINKTNFYTFAPGHKFLYKYDGKNLAYYFEFADALNVILENYVVKSETGTLPNIKDDKNDPKPPPIPDVTLQQIPIELPIIIKKHPLEKIKEFYEKYNIPTTTGDYTIDNVIEKYKDLVFREKLLVSTEKIRALGESFNSENGIKFFYYPNYTTYIRISGEKANRMIRLIKNNTLTAQTIESF